MDQPNNLNFWGKVSQDISEDELHAQTIDRIRIISTELLKLAQESQQQVYALKEHHEQEREHILNERNCLAEELDREREKNRKLIAKLAVVEKKLSDMQTRWTELSKEMLRLDADMDDEPDQRNKHAKLHQ